MENKRKHINHSEIVKYWSTPENNKYGGWIYIFLEDKDFPRCQCCGIEKEKWSKLERTHIIAHSLGGENIASNYFLLCKECHKNMPDIHNREYIIKYIENYYTKYLEELYNEFNEYMNEVNVTENELIQIEKNLSDRNKDELKEYFKRTITTHRADTMSPFTIRKIPKFIGIIDMILKDKVRRKQLTKGQNSFAFD